MLHFLKHLVGWAIGFFLLINAVGCSAFTEEYDPVQDVQSLRDLGFRGQARFFYNSSAHIGGFAYNPAGTASAFVEVDLDPSQAPDNGNAATPE